MLFASLKLLRCFIPLFSLQSSLKVKWNLSERKRGQKSTRIENMSILTVHVLSLCCFWARIFFRVFRHVINPDATRDSLCIFFSQSRPLDFDYSGFYFMTFVFDKPYLTVPYVTLPPRAPLRIRPPNFPFCYLEKCVWFQ